MEIQKVTSVFPVDDLPGAIRIWSSIFGIAPSFVDGDRWAQFDLCGHRVALAGSDRAFDVPGLMIKVLDLASSAKQMADMGFNVSPPLEGPHEIRCSVETSSGSALVLYAAKGS
jgi:hypothetical protein